MPTRTNYESTIAPASFTTLGSGPNAANLGKRNERTLDEAFGTPNGAGEVSRTTEGSQQELLRIAQEKLSDYAGENPMFQEYRRNFVPAGGTLTDEYVDPRNKNLSEEQIKALKLGTPYTPTIASPGAAAGIDPSALTSVASDINGVKPDEAGLDNPASSVHQNTDETNEVSNIGKVRKFKLGVGSGASNGASPAAARGQFPRPLT